MNHERLRELVHTGVDRRCAALTSDPYRVQRVLKTAQEAQITGGYVVKKKLSLAMILLIISLLLISGVALAAFISNTAERFGALYGADWKNAALRGDIDTSRPSIRIGDVIYTMDDVIVTGIEQDSGSLTEDDSLCTRILATGTMKPAKDANVVLIPEDYLVSDPWNFDPYYNGHANIPEGSVSVLERAAATDADILCTRVTANGLVKSDGGLYGCDIVYAGILQSDGSVMFIMEIGLFDPVPRQDSYTLSVYVANHQVTSDGEHLMDTRVSEDWVFTIHPQQPEPSQSPALTQASIKDEDVHFSSWEDTVRPLLAQPTIITVSDMNHKTSWQMQAVVAESGNYADAQPVSSHDADAMVSVFGSTLTPNAVYVTFPNGHTCLGSLGSWGYSAEQQMVYEDDVLVGNEKVAYIHFPRNAPALNSGSYAASHQAVLLQAWQELQAR